MVNCTVRWRPSGGRGEYEVIPSKSLVGRQIVLKIDELGVDIPTETSAGISQGKPRLRKAEPNNRLKLHLVPLVMAAARLPYPARHDTSGTVQWPLESKKFIVSHMDFEIVADNGSVAILRPLKARILHSIREIDLRKRFAGIARDIADLPKIEKTSPEVAKALKAHRDAIHKAVNSSFLRDAAENVIRLQSEIFGKSNTTTIATIHSLPSTTLEEDITGKEGRILTRLHAYRERDRKLVKKAKTLFKAQHERLYCECCGFDPREFYGARGEDRIQAHHKTPMEELLPDSETKPNDLAMVCPNCHDIIHAKRPWISVEELHNQLVKSGNHFFK